MPALSLLLVASFSYLLGSIPFGLLLTKAAGFGDIRKIGSGNIGATNVLRTGKKGLAILTILLDGGKGAVAVLLARYLYPDSFLPHVAALTSLLGHMFPVWLKFKGGKGVATSAGILTAMAWPIGVMTMLIWTAAALLSRYSSLAALIAGAMAPVNAFLFGRMDVLWLFLIIACLVIAKHGENIKRLLNRTESKIGETSHATSNSE